MTSEDNEMNDEHECSDMPSMEVSFPGPFTHHDVVVRGWRVPYLQAHMESEDRVTLVIDRRLAGEFSVEEAERVVPFVANAIAVAMGYGAHPRADTPRPLARAPYPRPERIVDLFALPDA
jgi:hypothetical protein